MKIAIPLDKELLLYTDNPFTAPKFAIYLIDGNKSDISYSLLNTVDNPLYIDECDIAYDKQKLCACDDSCKNDIKHICEHYALLEVISSCSYLLADKYCKNTLNSLKNGGIKIFRIPSIIKRTDIAIKNFLIGAFLASNIQNITNAS